MKRPELMIRWAAALEFTGLLLVGLAVVNLTPVTFLVFGGIGVPLILAGMFMFVQCMRKEAVGPENEGQSRIGA